VAKYFIEQGPAFPYVREKVWSCLTCGLCEERCPSGIAFGHFVREIRSQYMRTDGRLHLSHGGALQGIMRMQSRKDLRQHRLDWVTPGLKISTHGDVLYFVGCLPYFEAFFVAMDLPLTRIAVETVKVLNALGIAPVVLAEERCCGHDLIWTGDEEAFQKLRHMNLQAFHDTGAKTIVTACAECSHVLKQFYGEDAGSFPFEVKHLSEFLLDSDFPVGNPPGWIATYQDPCRLGRFQGVYEAPRELLKPLLEYREMRHSGPGAWCCGNSAWLHCDRYSKQIQVERLREAKETGSDVIVTACPKCQVHLTCAMKDNNLRHDLKMEIKDLSSVMADSIGIGAAT